VLQYNIGSGESYRRDLPGEPRQKNRATQQPQEPPTLPTRESTARLVLFIYLPLTIPGPLPTTAMATAHPRRWALLLQLGIALGILLAAAEAWTGEISGRVVCDVCGDAAIGPEDHALEGQTQPRTPASSSPLPSCGFIDRPLRCALWFPS
jgi:hypothetical protein